MSRILSGKLTLTGGVVLFSDLVSGIVESMQLHANDKGVEIATSIEPGIELVSADSSRITQVVSNLLTNAIKFTPRGGRVTTTLTSSNEQAILTVTDTGEGIAPEFIPHLFDRFRQADSSITRRHGGLGIGLAIARHLISLHGGRISATSAGKGQGATFTVVIPLHCRQEDVSTKCAEVSPTITAHPQETLRGSRIVIVEDNPASLEFLSRWLSDKGAFVVACSDGASAIDAVSSQRPDLIISDVGMPGMNGYKLVSYLKQIVGGDLPIIAVTGFARPEDEARALSAGFDAHLAKPIDLDKLEQTVLHFTHGPTRWAV
jgi:CheY-like chemotaxis protein/two-component sensor histidine kinase